MIVTKILSQEISHDKEFFYKTKAFKIYKKWVVQKTIKTAWKHVYNLISYRWNLKSVFRSFCSKSPKMDIKKTDFFYLLVFISWFMALTIQKREIKLEIMFLDLKLAWKPNFSQLCSKLSKVSSFLRRPIFWDFESFNWPFLNSHFQNFEILTSDLSFLGRFGLVM